MGNNETQAKSSQASSIKLKPSRGGLHSARRATHKSALQSFDVHEFQYHIGVNVIHIKILSLNLCE